jgi:hypothetical protein
MRVEGVIVERKNEGSWWRKGIPRIMCSVLRGLTQRVLGEGCFPETGFGTILD